MYLSLIRKQVFWRLPLSFVYSDAEIGLGICSLPPGPGIQSWAMGYVFENHSYRHASRGRCWAVGIFPSCPFPCRIPRRPGLQAQAPAVGTGQSHLGAAAAAPARCLRLPREGGRDRIASQTPRSGPGWRMLSSAFLPPSILPLCPPRRQQRPGTEGICREERQFPGRAGRVSTWQGRPWPRHVRSFLPLPSPHRSTGARRGAPPLPFCVRTVSPLVRSPNTARGPSMADIFPPERGATRTAKGREGAERRTAGAARGTLGARPPARGGGARPAGGGASPRACPIPGRGTAQPRAPIGGPG